MGSNTSQIEEPKESQIEKPNKLIDSPELEAIAGQTVLLSGISSAVAIFTCIRTDENSEIACENALKGFVESVKYHRGLVIDIAKRDNAYVTLTSKAFNDTALATINTLKNEMKENNSEI